MILQFTEAATHAVLAILLLSCRGATLASQSHQSPDVQASGQPKQITAAVPNVRDHSNGPMDQENEVENLQRNLRALKKELADTQNQTSEADKVSLNQILEAALGAQKAIEQTVQAQEEAQSAKQVAQNALLQAQQFQKEAQDLQTELQTVKAAAKRAADAAVQAKTETENAQIQFAQARHEADDLRNQLGQFKTGAQDLQIQFAQIKKAAEDAVAQAKKEKEDVQIQFAQARREADDLRNQLGQDKNEVQDAQNQVAPGKIASDAQSLVPKIRGAPGGSQHASPPNGMVGNATCSFYVEKSREMEKRVEELQTATKKLKIEVDGAHAETDIVQATLAALQAELGMPRSNLTTPGSKLPRSNLTMPISMPPRPNLPTPKHNASRIRRNRTILTCEQELEVQQNEFEQQMHREGIKCAMQILTLSVMTYKYHHVTFCFGGGQMEHFVN